jgi:translation initiation factor IF-2
MRARGAQVTDIAIIAEIAADDDIEIPTNKPRSSIPIILLSIKLINIIRKRSKKERLAGMILLC